MKEGVEIVEGGIDVLDEFYDVLSRNWRDLGSPLYSKSFFASILKAFPDTAFLLIVRHGSRPIASGFFLGFRDRLEIPWAASIRDYNRIAVNMALYWEGLKRAIEKGYHYFDFGRSSVDSGTYRFKRQWGAEPRQLYWHYWLRDGNDIPRITPDNPKYKLAIKAWQNLPVSVASTVGPMIAKYLP
jgi:FemAB-related protein (PEP-CTERM system-associated)